MVACNPCGPAVEVESVRILRPKNWPEQWIWSARPGDLLLLDGPIGGAGGILRLKIQGAFVALSADQVWRGESVTWPVPNSPIKRFRIVGQEIRYTLG
jgi:hypothetical protein